jgi:hypothetical protein
MLNSYEQFFALFPKESFIKFGIENIITVDVKEAAVYWDALKKRIQDKEPNLYVRSSGRNGAGNQNLQAFYKEIFGMEIIIDPLGNLQPTVMLNKLSGQVKNKTIQNYQVSHVFGRTKNVFCFTAPWNVIFIPKLVDPLTGHEAKGNFVDEFTSLLQKTIRIKFADLIDDYNSIISSMHDEIKGWISNNIDTKKQLYFWKDFEII